MVGEAGQELVGALDRASAPSYPAALPTGNRPGMG